MSVRAGSQPGGQWVLSKPTGPSCSVGDSMLNQNILTCVSECLRGKKNDFFKKKCCSLVKKITTCFSLFHGEGYSRFSATPAVPVALCALGTFQGPGVIGAFLAGEPPSGLNPPLSLLLSPASRSFPL